MRPRAFSTPRVPVALGERQIVDDPVRRERQPARSLAASAGRGKADRIQGKQEPGRRSAGPHACLLRFEMRQNKRSAASRGNAASCPAFDA